MQELELCYVKQTFTGFHREREKFPIVEGSYVTSALKKPISFRIVDVGPKEIFVEFDGNRLDLSLAMRTERIVYLSKKETLYLSILGEWEPPLIRCKYMTNAQLEIHMTGEEGDSYSMVDIDRFWQVGEVEEESSSKKYGHAVISVIEVRDDKSLVLSVGRDRYEIALGETITVDHAGSFGYNDSFERFDEHYEITLKPIDPRLEIEVLVKEKPMSRF